MMTQRWRWCASLKRAEELGHSSLVKEAARYAEEMGLQLQLEYPNPTCIKHDSEEVITAEKLKTKLRKGLEQKTWEPVHEQSWQGKLTCMRREEISLNFDGCFRWLSGWKQCPTHAVPGMFELYEQLLPTRLYAYQKTHTDTTGEMMCRLCNKAPESVAHVLAGCTALHPILFFEILQDLGLLDSVPLKPKPVYELNNAQAFWDVPLFAERQEVRKNRVDARIINHVSKRVITLEMSFPWVTNWEKKKEEKTR